MSNAIILTRTGRQVRALLLLAGAAIIVGVVLYALLCGGQHAPITDAAWHDGVASRLWEIRHGR